MAWLFTLTLLHTLINICKKETKNIVGLWEVIQNNIGAFSQQNFDTLVGESLEEVKENNTSIVTYMVKFRLGSVKPHFYPSCRPLINSNDVAHDKCTSY